MRVPGTGIEYVLVVWLEQTSVVNVVPSVLKLPNSSRNETLTDDLDWKTLYR